MSEVDRSGSPWYGELARGGSPARMLAETLWLWSAVDLPSADVAAALGSREPRAPAQRHDRAVAGASSRVARPGSAQSEAAPGGLPSRVPPIDPASASGASASGVPDTGRTPTVRPNPPIRSTIGLTSMLIEPDPEPESESESDDAPAGAVRRPGGASLARRYAAGPRAESMVADPLFLHRALHGFYRPEPAVDRWELDETATAERLSADELGIPARRPRMEPAYELHLVVDDSPTMTLWLDLVPALTRLLEQGRFRDVRVSYLDTSAERPEQVRLRASRAGPGTTPAADTAGSGRRIVWIVTDTLAPAWRLNVLSPALHHWARRGPVALVNLLPQRVWRWGGLNPRRIRMVPARDGVAGTAPRWDFTRSWDRELTGMSERELARALPVPVLELAPEWLAPWAEMVSAQPPQPTELLAVLVRPAKGSVSSDWAGSAGPADGPDTPRQQVDRLRRQASPVAFELAVALAAAPLTWSVLRLVIELVPAAGRRHLSEVLGSGILLPAQRSHGDDRPGSAARIAWEFAAGVREELLAHGERTAALQVLRAAASVIVDEVDALREFDLVLASERPEDVGLPVVTDSNRPFLVVEQTVLASVAGRYIRRSRRLGAFLVGGVPEAPESVSANTTSSVRGMTVSSEAKDGRPPAPRADSDPAISPVHAVGSSRERDVDRDVDRGGDADRVTTAATAVTGAATGAVRGVLSAWPVVLGGALPQRNPHFTGRGDLLRDLHQRLGGGTTAVLPEALHGMGGVGKSQLAVEYVYRYGGEYELVWWIPAEHTAQIVQGLTDLARALRLDAGREANAALPVVREALRTGRPHQRWLLVFDNAEDPGGIVDFFPNVGVRGHILVTSRDSRWTGVARSLEVAVFARAESKA
ncbi:SAV_2336 N-terminal domain-related protein, partial [Frankia sp. AiPs1]